MHKRISSLAALLGGAVLLVFGELSLGQNLLQNPDLDNAAVSTQVLATPVNWTASASKAVSGAFNDGMSSEGFANVLQPGGLGLFFKPFQGTQSSGDVLNATLNQSVGGGVAGKQYTLTGWAGAGTGYIGLTDPNVKSEFRLDFLNSSFSVICSNILDLKAAGLGTPNGNPFGYAQYSISATAPAGTLFVRAQADMLNAYGNPAGGDQAFVVDSFSLYAPEPASMGLIGICGVALLTKRRNTKA